MFVVILEPRTNEIAFQRRLGPHEVMNARKFANFYASLMDMEIDDQDGHIPDCSGDVRIEFRQRRDCACVIHSAESFFYK